MAKTLNFNNVKKQYFTVTLPDKNETTIMIGTPTKAVFDELTSVEATFKAYEKETDSAEEIISDLYDLVARVMSYNKGNIRITKEMLAECLDIEDIILFFKSYLGFISEIQSLKN